MGALHAQQHQSFQAVEAPDNMATKSYASQQYTAGQVCGREGYGGGIAEGRRGASSGRSALLITGVIAGFVRFTFWRLYFIASSLSKSNRFSHMYSGPYRTAQPTELRVLSSCTYFVEMHA